MDAVTKVNTPQLVSVHVGVPIAVEGEQAWHTSIFKKPISKPVWLRHNNLDGDRQADLAVHGGPDKAVCVYSQDHYIQWRQDRRLRAMEPGAFGENFTVAGMTERDVCIGDEYQVGEALVEVSQPRSPCWKLARRWSAPDLPRLVLASGRTGWYLRVLREGHVQAGNEMVLLRRKYQAWTIERVNSLSYEEVSDRNALDLASLADCSALTYSWRIWLARKFEQAVQKV